MSDIITIPKREHTSSIYDIADDLIALSMTTNAGGTPSEYDWEGLARAGFTDPHIARQVGQMLQLGGHLGEGSVTNETAKETMRVLTAGLADLVLDRAPA